MKERKESANHKSLVDVLFHLNQVGTKPQHYNLPSSNTSSRVFWNEVSQNNIIPEFEGYSGETLRKYWRTLNETNNFDELWELTEKNKEYINKYDIKLLTLIKSLQTLAVMKKEHLEDILDNSQKMTEKIEIPKVERPKKEKVQDNVGRKRRSEQKRTT